MRHSFPKTVLQRKILSLIKLSLGINQARTFFKGNTYHTQCLPIDIGNKVYLKLDFYILRGLTDGKGCSQISILKVNIQKSEWEILLLQLRTIIVMDHTLLLNKT